MWEVERDVGQAEERFSEWTQYGEWILQRDSVQHPLRTSENTVDVLLKLRSLELLTRVILNAK